MISGGRRPMMAGNWKLNPKSVQESMDLSSALVALTEGVTDVDIVVFPPMPFLYPVQQVIGSSNVKLGGQNCYHQDSGAYTGATSTCMLKDIGVEYVMCGHSERRSLFGDEDSIISKKVLKVLAQGLKPVLCIGETQDEYEAGLNHEVCAIQIMKDLQGVTPEQMKYVTLAYEPVWAIGTGLVCPKEVAQEVHQFIRSLIRNKYGDDIANNIIIQYGGSVNPGNVKELMAMPDIDGCLVGGASLTADSFSKIINFKDQ
jgi:triosephosphate isomerase